MAIKPLKKKKGGDAHEYPRGVRDIGVFIDQNLAMWCYRKRV